MKISLKKIKKYCKLHECVNCLFAKTKEGKAIGCLMQDPPFDNDMFLIKTKYVKMIQGEG